MTVNLIRVVYHVLRTKPYPFSNEAHTCFFFNETQHVHEAD